MNSILRPALWAGASICMVALSAAITPTAGASAVPDCAPAWLATKVYESTMKSSLKGLNYTSRWWHHGLSPDTNSSSRADGPVWQPDGPCKQPALLPACFTTWSASIEYDKPTQVSQSGRNFRARWKSIDSDPTAHSGPDDAWSDEGPCGGGSSAPSEPTKSSEPPPPVVTPRGKATFAYFPSWAVHDRNYFVKNIDTSGSAARLTHLLYAFGNTTGGRCVNGEEEADYQKIHSAAQSVDGVADAWDQPLRGSFNQLLKLKRKYPHLKMIWSFGGWTWSAGFNQAAADPTGFANSCYNLLNDPRWAGLWDGIDIDWEYPNVCTIEPCDRSSGPGGYARVISALRAKFGTKFVITSAITGDGSDGGKLDAADYVTGIASLTYVLPMTYDYTGEWNPQGPTGPHSPLTSYPGAPSGFWSDAVVQKLRNKKVPANKMLLGVNFYGRGWSGVTQTAPGGTATAPAPGFDRFNAGQQPYRKLKTTCPTTGTIGGAAYARCGNEWFSYDTPGTLRDKMAYVTKQGLGGTFIWELSGDTDNGELITATADGLQ
ncbi:glycoside hydrolase family 18 protein [Actinoplanes couchii]|uniref:chitinase n=2 Tax=Actinoplanes couchii TaxID=403638 RepID=A0ABQ3X8J4_9ACTN|nr:glycoside hydrolase family 18 protein [Actinoplanes couchii]MDR6320249.1 chitinase [Actinoplanes couchii]GID54738.1 hypothetical protein Aco03nite_031420 [Actinoplanes couchii]